MMLFSSFKLNVTYRRNCDFRVEDSERDLSAQFIDMDEHFFTPTMAKYQQEYTRPRPVSSYTPRREERSSLDNTKMVKFQCEIKSLLSHLIVIFYIIGKFKTKFLHFTNPSLRSKGISVSTTTHW